MLINILLKTFIIYFFDKGRYHLIKGLYMLNSLLLFFTYVVIVIVGLGTENLRAIQCMTEQTPPDHHIDDANITTERLISLKKTLIRNSKRPWDTLNLRYLPVEGMSGSGQYSKEQLQQILSEIETRYKISRGKMLVVDLRGEAHVFADEEPISILDKKDESTATKEYRSTQENLIKEKLANQNITLIPHRFTVNHPPMISREVLEKQPITRVFRKIETEEEVTQGLRVHYVRIPIPDYSAPTLAQIQFFEDAIKKSGAEWVHIHCHGGLGRSTTFMAVLDMIRQPNLSLDEIIERQWKAGGRDMKGPPEAGQRPEDAARILDILKNEYAKRHSDTKEKV